MRIIFALFFLIIFGVNSTFAYELVLPKEKKSIVNTNYAFFVGKANKTEEITINGERIYIASNGAFAHSVKLKDGENRIVMKSNFKTQIYKFYREPVKQASKPEVVEMIPSLYKVCKDNTPLRSTPQDFGMNRIAHLFKDTNLIIDGKKGDFYRVFLSKNKEAWISKNAVINTEEKIEPKFITMHSETYKNASKHIIEFTEKLPYTVDETDKEIIFKIYNPIIAKNSVYTINIKKPEKYSYKILSNGGEYVFKVSELPTTDTSTLEGLTIVVDAGHGGSEKGAIGCLGNNEKDLNLLIAQELKEILSQMGANIIMTRECDGNVSLEERVKIATENCSNIFISIHLNSIPDTKFDIHKHKGTSVYYYNCNSRKIAETVQKSLVETLNTRNDGVNTASFAVLRPTDYIGILIEVAYMTNPNDSLIYLKECFPQETAQAIAEGIYKYIMGE